MGVIHWPYLCPDHGNREAWPTSFHSTVCLLGISRSGCQQGCFSFSLSFLWSYPLLNAGRYPNRSVYTTHLVFITQLYERARYCHHLREDNGLRVLVIFSHPQRWLNVRCRVWTQVTPTLKPVLLPSMSSCLHGITTSLSSFIQLILLSPW